MGKLFFNRPQTLSVLGYRRTVFRRAFESLKFSSCLRYNLTARIFSYHACFSAFRSEAKTKLFEITSCRREEKNEMGAGTLIKLREHLLWLPIRNSNCGASQVRRYLRCLTHSKSTWRYFEVSGQGSSKTDSSTASLQVSCLLHLKFGIKQIEQIRDFEFRRLVGDLREEAIIR